MDAKRLTAEELAAAKAAYAAYLEAERGHRLARAHFEAETVAVVSQSEYQALGELEAHFPALLGHIDALEAALSSPGTDGRRARDQEHG